VTGWPKQTEGPHITRKNPCGFCQAAQGMLIAKAEFWDLAQVDYVHCDKCGLTQVDPMLTPEVTAKGCEAYYSMETLREGSRNLAKKMIRSFRKGVHFAYKIRKLGLYPHRVLEVGAGDGCFSKGVQFVFPDAEITCLDIVPEVLNQIASNHGFKTVLGTPEEIPSPAGGGLYDLIIARDIIEHTLHPSKVIESFSRSLRSGGMVHIITPNGFEDIWTAYCRWKLRSEPSAMLINHVNFFSPGGLKAKFTQAGFTPKLWFMYDFNGTRWGRARYMSQDQMAEVSAKLSAEQTIASNAGSLTDLQVKPRTVLNKWWIQPRLPWITKWYCFFKEARRLVLPADTGIGHEIYGLFQKS
jgi:SAM-dependent methyltransferase